MYPLLVDPDASIRCTADISGAWQFVVALDRARLPAGPFMLQLGPTDPPAGAPKERTVVEIDLSQAGVDAAKGDVHFDRELGKPQPWRSGAVLEPFGEWDYALDTRCGIGSLGEINAIDWATDATAVPDAWAPAVGDDGELVVKVAIRSEPEAHVDATANGLTIRYLPATAPPLACPA